MTIAKLLSTESELDRLLTSLGFTTGTVQSSTRKLVFEEYRKDSMEEIISRGIDASPNHLDTHIIVSVENDKFCIYFY